MKDLSPLRPNFLNVNVTVYSHNIKFKWPVICRIPAYTRYSMNICWVFPQCRNVWGTQGTFMEHFRKKIFLKFLYWKVVFVLKLYDLIITNIDLLANSSNHKAMFPVYSRNIPRMSVSKSFHGCSRNVFQVYENIFVKKIIWTCEIFNIGSVISWMFFWTLLKPFFISFEKFRTDAWQLAEK